MIQKSVLLASLCAMPLILSSCGEHVVEVRSVTTVSNPTDEDIQVQYCVSKDGDEVVSTLEIPPNSKTELYWGSQHDNVVDINPLSTYTTENHQWPISLTQESHMEYRLCQGTDDAIIIPTTEFCPDDTTEVTDTCFQ